MFENGNHTVLFPKEQNNWLGTERDNRVEGIYVSQLKDIVEIGLGKGNIRNDEPQKLKCEGNTNADSRSSKRSKMKKIKVKNAGILGYDRSCLGTNSLNSNGKYLDLQINERKQLNLLYYSVYFNKRSLRSKMDELKILIMNIILML